MQAHHLCEFSFGNEIHYILPLLGHLIVCRKNYKDVLIYNMQDMSKPIVTLLESKIESSCGEISLINEEYIAIIFLDEKNGQFIPNLGIWNIHDILKGFLLPKQQIDLDCKEIYGLYSPSIQRLTNKEFALVKRREIVIYNLEAKQISKYSTQRNCHSCTGVTASLNFLRMDACPTTQIEHIDLVTKKRKLTKLTKHVSKNSWVNEFVVLSDQCVAFSIRQSSNPDNFRHFLAELHDQLLLSNQIGIWDVHNGKLIKRLYAESALEDIKMLNNGDLVSITQNGMIEYWDTATNEKWVSVKIPLNNRNQEIVITVMDNHALLVNCYDFDVPSKLFYVPPPEKYKKEQESVLNLTEEIIICHYKIPEIKHLIRGYLGFFAPKGLKKIDVPIVEDKKRIYQ